MKNTHTYPQFDVRKLANLTLTSKGLTFLQTTKAYLKLKLGVLEHGLGVNLGDADKLKKSKIEYLLLIS